jgi:hypothetical protein
MLRDNREGERGYDEDTCSGNGGSLFPSSRETEKPTQRRRFSGFATRKWGGSRRCFLLIRVYHGLARVHEEKIRFPNRRFSITRLGPSAAKHGRQENGRI